MGASEMIMEASVGTIHTKKSTTSDLTEMRTLKMEGQGSRKDQEVDDRKEKMGSERRPMTSIHLDNDNKP